MTIHELTAVMNGVVIGTVIRERTGRLNFEYADEWRHHPGAIPLSLSMPLVRAAHAHAAIDAFLWGLLPDNEQTLAPGRPMPSSRRFAHAQIPERRRPQSTRDH